MIRKERTEHLEGVERGGSTDSENGVRDALGLATLERSRHVRSRCLSHLLSPSIAGSRRTTPENQEPIRTGSSCNSSSEHIYP